MANHDQSKLSERLHLLSELQYSDLGTCYQGAGQPSNKAIRDKQTNRIIRVLDTIAVALTTGEKGDVLAVGLSKPEGLELVLAKNARHTTDDDHAADSLLGILKDSETTEADVMPFLLRHCKQNIDKRVTKMREALHECQKKDLTKTVGAYPRPSQPFSVKTEFPDSDFYFARENNLESMQFVETMRKLWLDISKKAEAFLKLTEGSASVEDIRLSFTALAMFAIVLEKSPFLHWLCKAVEHERAGRRQRVQRLKRRLAKVCQYYQGIQKLVQYANQFPAHSISYRWVSHLTGTDGIASVQLGGYKSVMLSVLKLERVPEEIEAGVKERFSKLAENWKRIHSVKPRLHAEISIMVHLDNSPENRPNHEQGQQPIGCSKRSCLGCTLWIDAYNRSVGTKWLTSGSHGKPYSAWALPGRFLRSVGHTLDVKRECEWSAVDGIVMKNVELRLVEALKLLQPSENMVSDEHWSSSESEEEAESEV